MKKFFAKVKAELEGKRGEGYIDTAVKMIIAVVIGALLLGGLYFIFNDMILAFNPYLTYLLLPAIVGALYFVGGVSMWTVKGIVLALILLRASVQDLSERKADEFLWVMPRHLTFTGKNEHYDKKKKEDK